MLPTRWNWFVNGFRRYVRRYVRKHFHAVRLSHTSHPLPVDNAPLLLVLNHPSWWDPMIGVVLADLFPTYTHYAAIDAAMLKKYWAFNKLGFFGVDQTNLRGAAEFLKTGTEILSADRRAVWVTAQGHFADVRTRPLNLRSGVGHLTTKLDRGWVVPIALEYTFWTESKPEALVRIGEPMSVTREPTASAGRGKAATARIESALTASLDVLNRETQTRDPARFTELLGGTVGVGGVYDAFRRSVAFVRGERFDPSHMATTEKPA
ncbi:MAG: lysophospholipid acyltransferase family protein [Fimbriiglobus sp.]|jgi:1-acyl-sn-glycerol-3-phosphate acyltransferase|nr:lysophospholipid acyltransferase family protein [Fimbriiglobus sp.]